jgi:hypothetical protein
LDKRVRMMVCKADPFHSPLGANGKYGSQLPSAAESDHPSFYFQINTASKGSSVDNIVPTLWVGTIRAVLRDVA